MYTCAVRQPERKRTRVHLHCARFSLILALLILWPALTISHILQNALIKLAYVKNKIVKFQPSHSVTAQPASVNTL